MFVVICEAIAGEWGYSRCLHITLICNQPVRISSSQLCLSYLHVLCYSGPVCLKSITGIKHFPGFYLKWQLFPAAEIQTSVWVSALETGLWAPLKGCGCTCHKREGSSLAQALKRLHSCFETKRLLKLRGCSQGTRNNYLLSCPPAPYLQPLSALDFKLWNDRLVSW